MAIFSSLFSVCPRVRKEEDRLVARTAWRLLVLTLGGFYRRVEVDPGKKEVTVYRRYFWVFARRRRIRFGNIEAVTYGYKDWAFGASWSWAHDSVDSYSVGLRLRNDDDLHLFSFFGDGTFQNDGPWPDWLYWDDYLLDLSGTQTQESRAFVELVSKLVGVSVVPGRY